MTYEQERELELQKKVIPQTMKPDFAQFWEDQVNQLRQVPTDFCMGLADPICLPHFVYTAYAHTTCEKKLFMYPFVLHEVPQAYKLVAHGEFAKL